MKVSELIEELNKFPQDADVAYVWDGEVRGLVELVYLSNDGDTVLAQEGDVIYSDGSRPFGTPTGKEREYYYTLKTERNEC